MKAEEIKERAEKAEGQLKSVEIPEWKCEVFFTSTTIEDQQYIQQKFKGIIEDNLALSIELIMRKAVDEDRKPIWTTEEDRKFLRTVASEKTMTKMILAISGATIEEAKKNSKKAPS